MRRAIVIVLDGCGAGAAPDVEAFGDSPTSNTLLNTWKAVGGFDAPLLDALGFLAPAGISRREPLIGRCGRLRPLSMGKDSVTGHWEMMGAIVERAFPTYPNGFPISVIKAFERAIGRQTLGNRAESGTEIIARLGQQHVETGAPIVYTSADSVFQIAAHEDVIPIEQLYEICRMARELLKAPNNVQRVIARPFVGNAKDGFTRTGNRKDFPLAPPPNLVDQIGDVVGIGVVPELFDGRGFRPGRRTQSNPEHEAALLEALATDARFIFANFEDFDMLYGHRNDVEGFARCLERFDAYLGSLIPRLGSDDLLILTSDHGNDPTTPSTDHSREYVPVAAFHAGIESAELGDLDGLAAVGQAVAVWLGALGHESSQLLA
ncbi:MAG: phosphopentomutase [Fimbriimonadaceae bacterium]